MKVLINGKIKDIKKTSIDTGYFYGYGVFETILVHKGEAVFAKEHVNRLNKSVKKLSIKQSVTIQEVEHAVAALRLYNGALKINVSEKNVVYSTREIPYTKEDYKQGFKLKVSSVLRNPTSPSVAIKSMNYMDNIIEMKKAREEGYNDALFLNFEAYVCETAVANIFVIKEGKIMTPKVECGLLNGIVRQWVVSNYEVEECKMTLDDLENSEGVFITNSLMGIMKVSMVNDVIVSESQVLSELSQKYVEAIKLEGV